MANYYRIFSEIDSVKLALSLTSTPLDTTKLNGVLNINGTNKALFSCSLDLLGSSESYNTIIQSSSGISEIDISHDIGFGIETPLQETIGSIFELLESAN
jgi:hypothetical protein